MCNRKAYRSNSRNGEGAVRYVGRRSPLGRCLDIHCLYLTLFYLTAQA